MCERNSLQRIYRDEQNATNCSARNCTSTFFQYNTLSEEDGVENYIERQKM